MLGSIGCVGHFDTAARASVGLPKDAHRGELKAQVER